MSVAEPLVVPLMCTASGRTQRGYKSRRAGCEQRASKMGKFVVVTNFAIASFAATGHA